MNILPYDQGFGDALAYDSTGRYFRDVIIQIDGSWQTYLTFSNTPEGIQTALNSKGWLAEQVEDVSTAWIPGLTHFTYRIYAVVGMQYSDAQIQAQVQRDLAGVFQVTGVSILSQPYSGLPVPNSTPTPNAPSTRPPTNYPPVNYPTATPPAADPNAPKPNSKAWNDFWANLGFTVIPTVGTVALIGGLGLGALLLIRER